MDIKDAIDILHDIINEGFTVGDRVFPVDDEERKALEIATSALNELQQGSLEECRAALEKQKMKKPFKSPDGNMNCYVCEEVVKYPEQYCLNCGQAIDWRDVL